MNLQPIKLAPREFAQQLRSVRVSKSTVNPPSSFGDVSLSWAQEVQREDLSLRIDDGECVIGAKLGLTSFAKQQTMKINQPVFGFLTDAMIVNKTISVDSFKQPRIEPELIFTTSKEISSAITLDEVPLHIDSIAAGFEIIDSRYPNFNFTFEDVIADNTSAAAFSVGGLHKYRGQDISQLTGYIEENEVLMGEGALSELLGNPLKTLVALSEYLHDLGDVLPAGSTVLAGSMTNAIPLLRGRKYRAGIRELGYVEIEVG